MNIFIVTHFNYDLLTFQWLLKFIIFFLLITFRLWKKWYDLVLALHHSLYDTDISCSLLEIMLKLMAHLGYIVLRTSILNRNKWTIFFDLKCFKGSISFKSFRICSKIFLYEIVLWDLFVSSHHKLTNNISQSIIYKRHSMAMK